MRASNVLMIVLLLCVSSCPYPRIKEMSAEGYAMQGPFINQIDSHTYPTLSDEVYALLDGELDLIGESLDPQILEHLQGAQNIGLANNSQNGYAFFLFNCDKYPLNMTILRRAIAFAFDKQEIVTDIWNGYAQPLDAPVSRINPCCAEDSLPFHYYEGEVELANSMLDEAGFEFNKSTGFRMAPNGESFGLLLEVPVSSETQLLVGESMEETMQLLHLNISCQSVDPYELGCECAWNDFDIRLLENRFTNMDLDWMARDFWHDTIRHPRIGLVGFSNASYESLRTELLNGTSFDDMCQTVIEMQKILVAECPIIVAYERTYISAFRTDKFREFPSSIHMGTSSWWTSYLVKLGESMGGPFGGTLRRGESAKIDTFNFITTTSHHASNILKLCYDSLMRQDRYGNDVPWLMTDYTVVTHLDDTSIPEGHERFVFDLITNASWTDGQPLTAEDVAFSLKYYRDAPGHPYARSLDDLVDAYASTQYTCIAEFDHESYWNLHAIAYKSVLPRHVFSEIGVNGWAIWNPQPAVEPIVVSGPFTIMEHSVDELCELQWNPNYFFSPNRTSSATPPTTTELPSYLTEILIIAGGAVVVIIGGVAISARRRNARQL